LTVIDWRVVRLWQTIDKQLNSPYEATATALSLADDAFDFNLNGN
ncbi:hypothetical protein LCGC14_2899580, partial [marine sediment metagenome]